MSGTFGQLLAWRWVTGIGSALQMAGAQLFLTDISLSTNRARTLGTNQARSRPCHTIKHHVILFNSIPPVSRCRKRASSSLWRGSSCGSCKSIDAAEEQRGIGIDIGI